MSHKFITPVSMEVTKEKYNKDLKEPLLKLGYIEVILSPFEDAKYITNNISGNLGQISNIKLNAASTLNRYFIDHYNPELFLALAAMTNKSDGIEGEWWKCSHGDVYSFLVGKLYRQNMDSVDGGSSPFTDNKGRENGFPNNLSQFIKATEEEIIEHFTKIKQKDMEDYKWQFKKGMEQYREAAEKIAKYLREPNKPIEEYVNNENHFHDRLREAGVLDLWFEKVEIKKEKIVPVNSIFSLTFKEGKIWHKSDDITNFVKDIATGTMTNYKICGYSVEISEIKFGRTGCEHNETTLDDWRCVWEEYLEFNNEK